MPIAGATKYQIILSHARFSDSGRYSVVVSNAEKSVTSAEVGLTVNSPKGGDIDFSFVVESSINDEFRSVAVQPDGKVLIAGDFTTVRGTVRGGIARLNADGTMDHTFMNRLSGANVSVDTVAVQTDGKVLIGGLFTTVNGVSRTNIARLNPDGTLDSGFQSRLSTANGEVSSVAVQSDGKVLVGGGFTMVNGVPAPGFVRLWGNADVSPRIQSVNRSGATVNLIWDALPNRTYRVVLLP